MSRFTTLIRRTSTATASRPNLEGNTWNRVFFAFANMSNVDGKKNTSAIFANSIFPHLDFESAARLEKIFHLDERSDPEIVKILAREVRKSGDEKRVRTLLQQVAKSCTKFSESFAGERLVSYYGPIAGEEKIRVRLAELWNEKHPEEESLDPEHIVITNSFKQAKFYAERIGGRAFGVDNKFLSAGFIICKDIDQRNEIKRVFNLAMVSSSVIHQLALLHYLEHNEKFDEEMIRDHEFDESISFMKDKTVTALSKIYEKKFNPTKVFLGNGAQNFVDRLSAFLKVQGYEDVLILASPYHLYPATIRQNKLNPVMIPVTDDLRATPEFIGLALEEQYAKWTRNGAREKCKVALLLNEPENPSGHKSGSKTSRAIANVVNDFAARTDVELTYITDGAYKVLYAGDQAYVQDFIDREKVKLISFESHSKSNWTFARLSFCILHSNITNEAALQILRDNEPTTLVYHALSLVAMESRIARTRDVHDHTQDIVACMNRELPQKFTHVEGEVYPFIFPKFPEKISDIAPAKNPEFRSKIIRTIFSAKFSNAQLAQVFNLDADEMASTEMARVIGNFHEQKFDQKDVDFLINLMIAKENSFEDRVSVLCDSIAPKSDFTDLDSDAKKSAYETIFRLKRLGKLDAAKAHEALSDIRQMMGNLGVEFGEECNLEDDVGRNNLLNRIDEELRKDNFELGFINCRNTLFSSFALIAHNGLCIANVGIGDKGRIVPRPAFGGLEKTEVSERISLLTDFLRYAERRNQEPATTIKMRETTLGKFQSGSVTEFEIE